jgi:hypothetical protein
MGTPASQKAFRGIFATKAASFKAIDDINPSQKIS